MGREESGGLVGLVAPLIYAAEFRDVCSFERSLCAADVK